MDTWCDGHVYDPFSSATRASVFGWLKDGYTNHGITNFWLDADEPERILDGDNGHWRYSAGWDSAVGMGYPLMHQQMVMDGLAAEGIPAHGTYNAHALPSNIIFILGILPQYYTC
jgi:alpha-glucosidase (family GH31 glycosyl hydrolase)